MMSRLMGPLALLVFLVGMIQSEIHPIDVEPVMKKEHSDFEVRYAHIASYSIECSCCDTIAL